MNQCPDCGCTGYHALNCPSIATIRIEKHKHKYRVLPWRSNIMSYFECEHCKGVLIYQKRVVHTIVLGTIPPRTFWKYVRQAPLVPRD